MLTLARRLVASVMAIFMALTISAQEATQGTGWSYNESEQTLTLSGSEVDWDAVSTFCNGESTIKVVVFDENYELTEAPEGSYDGSRFGGQEDNIEEVKFLSDKIESIGRNAFYHFTNITKVTLPTNLKTIGNGAFDTCKKIEELNLPGNLTTIGGCAFQNCYGIVTLVIPDKVETIGRGAFTSCMKLQYLTLPASLKSIGDYGFCSTNLMTVTLLSNGTEGNEHYILLGDDFSDEETDDEKKAKKGGSVFDRNKATLIYDSNKTWIGDDDTQNLRYYFDEEHRQDTKSSTSMQRTVAEPTSPTQYYDLGGRKVNAETYKGVVVKVQDGQSTMVTIK